MLEWMENGCLFGWLINPEERVIYVHHKLNVTTASFHEIIIGHYVLFDFKGYIQKIFSNS
jgi:hypothetical protein